MKPEYDENTLRRFLLGALSEQEQIDVEDAVFSGEDLRSRVAQTEHDLIDEYARGELGETEKKQFERMFFNSAERREKIEFARTLARLSVSKNANAAIEERKSFWTSLIEIFHQSQIVFAAVLLLILGLGAWILIVRRSETPQIAFGNVNRNENVEVVKTPTANLAAPTPVLANENTNPAPVIGSANNKSPVKNDSNKNSAAPTPVPSPVIKTPETAPTFAALLFPAGLLRDGGTKFRLVLPKTAKQARLIFNLEKGENFPFYEVSIADRSGAVVSQNKFLRRRQLIYNLAVVDLAAGFYTAAVRGVNADNSRETIGFYDFEVLKQ